jgi:hypothetical protein
LDEPHVGFSGTLGLGIGAARSWRHDLRSILRERGRATAEAIDHATGVYFPRRSHASRIAIKKFRYTMELADKTHVADLAIDLRALKKAQDVLGELHDRQELVDNLLEAVDGEAQTPLDAAVHVPLVKQVIDAECHELHQRYLAMREDLRSICASGSTTRHLERSKVAAGILMFSAGVYALRRQARDQGQPSSPVLPLDHARVVRSL